MVVFDPRRVGTAPPVLWTRGQGCGDLAALLSDVEPVRVVGDLNEACLRHRAELLVSRRLSGFELASMVVPIDFAPEEVDTVVAAVGGGPHSPLAARVARRLGGALGLPSMLACAYRDPAERDEAEALVESLRAEEVGIDSRLVEADDAAGLISQLPARSLLVLGAPGGSWLQRTLFGRGVRLRQKAPAGAVVVRKAPDRVFHRMVEPVFVSPLREAGDILRLHGQQVLAVVDGGRLVGVVDRRTLVAANPLATVSTLMRDPISVLLDAPAEEAASLREAFGRDPIPVVDSDGMLVGGVVAL